MEVNGKQVRLTDEQRTKLKDVFASLANETINEAFDEVSGGAAGHKEAHASGGWRMSSQKSVE
jgi:hypothetical protein